MTTVYEPLERVRNCVSELRKLSSLRGPPNTEVGSTADAHAALKKEAKAVAAQAKVMLFLVQSSPTAEDMLACASETAGMAVKLDSWARVLVSAVAPAARRLVGRPCMQVLETVVALIEKSAGGRTNAQDVAHVEKSCENLDELPVSTAAACSILLLDSHTMLCDAKSELDDSVREAAEEEAENGEGDQMELLATPGVSKPLRRLVDGAVAVVKAATAAQGRIGVAAAKEGGEPLSEATCGVLIIIGQAVSTQVDSLICAAHEDSVESLAKYGNSLAKMLKKLHTVLADKCGMAEDADRRKLEEKLEKATLQLAAACAARVDAAA